MSGVNNLKKELNKLADPKCKKDLQRYFKTGPGEYGEGDIFMGIKIWPLRSLAKKYDLSFSDITKLLQSKIHEHRMLALFMLIKKYEQGDEKTKKQVLDLYLKNTKYINNWDLVDISSHRIIGNYLLDKDRKILYKLVRSKNLWEKRIAIISTFAFLSKGDVKDSLELAKILLNDEHDLIHKAVGWALREVGKIDLKAEVKFLEKNYQKMPRTMLRYAIEKFPEKKRKYYLNKK